MMRRRWLRSRIPTRSLFANNSNCYRNGKMLSYVQRDNVQYSFQWNQGMGEKFGPLAYIPWFDKIGGISSIMKPFANDYNRIICKKICRKFKNFRVKCFYLIPKANPGKKVFGIVEEDYVKIVDKLKNGKDIRSIPAFWDVTVREEQGSYDQKWPIYFSKSHTKPESTSTLNAAQCEGVRRVPVTRNMSKYYRLYPGCKKTVECAKIKDWDNTTKVTAVIESMEPSFSFSSSGWCVGPAFVIPNPIEAQDKEMLVQVNIEFECDIFVLWQFSCRDVNLGV